MTAGQGMGMPHEHGPVDCSGTLLRLYEYLDGEMLADDGARIQAHLAACAQCLRQYHLDLAIKHAVRRACGCEPAPSHLRQAIIARIAVTSVTIEATFEGGLPAD